MTKPPRATTQTEIGAGCFSDSFGYCNLVIGHSFSRHRFQTVPAPQNQAQRVVNFQASGQKRS
jgi:hypothetical protein